MQEARRHREPTQVNALRSPTPASLEEPSGCQQSFVAALLTLLGSLAALGLQLVSPLTAAATHLKTLMVFADGASVLTSTSGSSKYSS